LFKVLVEKAVVRQATLDRAIARHLSKGWRLERLDAVARAILRAGAAELEQRTDIPIAVVIDEYVEIAHSFFDGPEPGFVNATLDACAKDLREGRIGA
jgi:N utilization substance protein B